MRIVRALTLLVALAVAFLAAAGDYVVVIDPGHGGKDAGALGDTAKEKDVVFEVGKRLKKLLEKEMTDVRVVMTRDNDRFVELQGRADIANDVKADIFVSIHANSVDKKSPGRSTVNGASVYTLGLKRTEANLAVAMRENSVIKLEKDYSTTYSGFDPNSTESYIMFDLLQHRNMETSIALAQEVENELVRTAFRRNGGVKQAPFWVLVQTSMPAILVELDFICNPTQEQFLSSPEGQDRLALAICKGIQKFRGKPVKHDKDKKADKTEKKAKEDKKEKQNEKPQVPAKDDGPLRFRVQFLTSPDPVAKKDARLKKIPQLDCYQDGGLYKYVAGNFKSKDDAQKLLAEIRQRYPDAFIITMQGDKRIK